MKPVKTIVVGTAIIFIVCFAVLINNSAASKPIDATVHGDGFAVLELFTSEGCSSCPPADELVARIEHEAGNTPVYVLAYHVDYWNRLGWKDAFSRAEFSKRQYEYSRQFTGEVYTPQLIINGKAVFVGSNEPAIRGAIKDALETTAPITLTLQAKQQADKINVSYQTKNGAVQNQLLLAVVQKQATSKVISGENGGRTLHHVQIVHNLYTFNPASAGEGTQQIAMPAGYNDHDWEVIGLLQNRQTGAISAAARARVL